MNLGTVLEERLAEEKIMEVEGLEDHPVMVQEKEETVMLCLAIH